MFTFVVGTKIIFYLKHNNKILKLAAKLIININYKMTLLKKDLTEKFNIFVKFFFRRRFA